CFAGNQLAFVLIIFVTSALTPQMLVNRAMTCGNCPSIETAMSRDHPTHPRVWNVASTAAIDTGKPIIGQASRRLTSEVKANLLVPASNRATDEFSLCLQCQNR